MPFRDETQAWRAHRLLLQPMPLETLTAPDGPADRGWTLFDQQGAPVSPADRALFLALWNGVGTLSLAEAVATLEPDQVRRFCSLWVAFSLGGEAVDAWIASQEARSAEEPRG